MEIVKVLQSMWNLEMVLWSLLLACIMTLFSLVFAAYVEKDRPAAKKYIHWADRVAYVIAFGFLPLWFWSGIATRIPVPALVGATIFSFVVALGEMSFKRFPKVTVWSTFLSYLMSGSCVVGVLMMLMVDPEMRLVVSNVVFGLSLSLYLLAASTLSLRFTHRYGSLRLVLPSLVKASS